MSFSGIFPLPSFLFLLLCIISSNLSKFQNEKVVIAADSVPSSLLKFLDTSDISSAYYGQKIGEKGKEKKMVRVC